MTTATPLSTDVQTAGLLTTKLMSCVVWVEKFRYFLPLKSVRKKKNIGRWNWTDLFSKLQDYINQNGSDTRRLTSKEIDYIRTSFFLSIHRDRVKSLNISE